MSKNIKIITSNHEAGYLNICQYKNTGNNWYILYCPEYIFDTSYYEAIKKRKNFCKNDRWWLDHTKTVKILNLEVFNYSRKK